jgi:hypothetical protein
MIIAALAIAHPARAASDQDTKDAKPAKAAKAKKAKPAAAPDGASQATPAKEADPKAKDSTASARFLFIRRVEMCSPPQHCSGETFTVVDEAEATFMNACKACASQTKCEEDRAKIREGKAQRSYNPCG